MSSRSAFTSPPVLIVGAGPTGLTLALRLVRHGIAVRIVEKKSGPGQTSRALAVHARTLEFYGQIGLAEEVIARGIPAQAVRLREGGREVAHVPFRDLGSALSPFPFVLCLAQDDHERFLVEKLAEEGIEIEWGVELKEITQSDDAVRVTLEKAGEIETCAVEYLCGCDGAHSGVRHALGLKFPGGDYKQIFYVTDVKLEGEATTDILMTLEGDGLVLMFPVRSSGMHRLTGTIPEAIQQLPSVSFEELRAFVEKMLGVRIETVNWFATYHVRHRLAPNFQINRVFLAGDACHVHSPAGGQGMNTGIADAINLAWKLANVLHGEASPALLATYDHERRAFARQLVNTTDRAFQGMVNQRPVGHFLRTWLVPQFAPLLSSVPFARRLFFKTLSQLRVCYHDSPLSQGHAGRLRGGDRLPWVKTPDGDNFTSLRALQWQIHVYGAATPQLYSAARELGLPLNTFTYDKTAEHTGFKRDAFYLVRPDGYIALATSSQDIAALTAFLARFKVRPRPE